MSPNRPTRSSVVDSSFSPLFSEMSKRKLRSECQLRALLSVLPASIPRLYALLPASDDALELYPSGGVNIGASDFVMHPLCEIGCHSIAHKGYDVVNMEGLLHVGLPYLKTLTVIVRAASTAGKMDGVKLPDAFDVESGYFDSLMISLDSLLPGPGPGAAGGSLATRETSLLEALFDTCAALEESETVERHQEESVSSYKTAVGIATELQQVGATLQLEAELRKIIGVKENTSVLTAAGLRRRLHTPSGRYLWVCDAHKSLPDLAPVAVGGAATAGSSRGEEPEDELEALRRRNAEVEALLASRGPESLVEYKGRMFKRGGGTSMFGRRGWKERFFVIEKGCLSYYASEANHVAGASAIKGWHIPLANYTLDRMDAVPGQFRLLPVTIKCEEAKRLDPKGVPSPSREFHFMIRNITAKEKWTTALGHHVAAIRK